MSDPPQKLEGDPLSASEPAAAQIIETPSPNDILMGRGRPFQKHPGNERMRRLVEENRARYNGMERQHRGIVANQLIDQLLSSGARFLRRREVSRQGSGIGGGGKKGKSVAAKGTCFEEGWEVASRPEAYEKVCHSLRAKYRGSSSSSSSAIAIQQHQQQTTFSSSGSSPLHREASSASRVTESSGADSLVRQSGEQRPSVSNVIGGNLAAGSLGSLLSLPSSSLSVSNLLLQPGLVFPHNSNLGLASLARHPVAQNQFLASSQQQPSSISSINNGNLTSLDSLLGTLGGISTSESAISSILRQQQPQQQQEQQQQSPFLPPATGNQRLFQQQLLSLPSTSSTLSGLQRQENIRRLAAMVDATSAAMQSTPTPALSPLPAVALMGSLGSNRDSVGIWQQQLSAAANPPSSGLLPTVETAAATGSTSSTNSQVLLSQLEELLKMQNQQQSGGSSQTK